MNRQETGKRGEKLAADFLKKKGYRILQTNYRCREGEIDIVSQKKDCLVFVEVRTKTSTEFGMPEESITFNKKEKLVASAFSYLNANNHSQSQWRIDFVAVELDKEGKTMRIEHIENAVAG